MLTGLLPKLRQCDMAASLSSKIEHQNLKEEQRETLFGWSVLSYTFVDPDTLS